MKTRVQTEEEAPPVAALGFTPWRHIPYGAREHTRVALSDANIDVGAMHIDRPLTNVSVAYQNAAFVAERIAPVIPVEVKSDKYWIYGFEKFRRRFTAMEPGTKPREIGWGISTDTYFCQGHKLRGWYPSDSPNNVDAPIDLDIDTTENTTEGVLLAQEMDFLDMLTAGLTAVDLSAAANGGGAFQFDNPDSDPVAFMDKQKETVQKAIGRPPNTLVMGRPAVRGARNNPNLLKHIYGTTLVAASQQFNEAALAEKFGIDNVIFADAMYDTAAEGATANLGYVWGNTCLLCYVEPKPGIRKVSLAYHFLWNVGNAGTLVRKWFDEDKERMNIDVKKYRDQKLIAAGAGVLFTNTLQNP
jgi:hypothetical protein